MDPRHGCHSAVTVRQPRRARPECLAAYHPEQAAALQHRTRAECSVYSDTVHLPAAIAILGLPGVGKTRLACGLAAALLDHEVSCLVVHTDVLKVTARALDAATGKGALLRGPGYAGDIAAKTAQLAPLLDAHVAKARRDGYVAIIEGTLALGVCAPDVTHLLLELDDAERRRRIERKHESAVRTLARCDLAAYAGALAQSLPPTTLRLDATAPPGALVARALDWIREPWLYAA
jgi:hypothetical protein